MRLEARDLSKSFGPIQALSNVSFAVEAGEIHGLCGENGAGKSTLVKILTGVYRADEGAVFVDGKQCDIAHPQAAQRAGIAFVSQELSIPPHLSVYDNVWLGHDATPFWHRRQTLRAQASRVLQLVGLGHLDLNTPALALSLGERQLLEIARGLARDAQILFLDEPTATLSNREIELVFATLRRLREQGRGIVFITHRLAEVFDLCDAVTVLRNGRIVASTPVASSSRDQLIEHMLGYSLGELYPERSHATGMTAITVSDLRVPGAVEGLSLSLAQGEIMCLAGQIGSGASESLRALAGLVYDAEGSVSVFDRPLALGSVPRSLSAGLTFVSDDRAAEGVFLKLPIRDNLLALWMQRRGERGLLQNRRLSSLAASLADRVGVDRRRMRSKASELSGGNQQKIAIGRAATAKRNAILLMNEPTRGVDVGARADIYQLMRSLCRDGFSILMASTDIEEVIGMSDVVVTMFRGASVASYRAKEVLRSQVLADIVHQERELAEALT